MEEPQKRGLFIAFEGIDGSGKTTQLKHAAKFIYDLSKDHDVLMTREPTRRNRTLREALQAHRDLFQPAQWFSQVFVQDRKAHVAEVIEPALRAGVHVLSDRFSLSTLAYQTAQGVPLIDLFELHKDVLWPDITFFLRCDPDVAQARKKSSGEQQDRFDADLDFQRKVAANYEEIIEQLCRQGECIYVINGELEEGQVAVLIQNLLLE
jgi:dTMP kinase